jgi:hypothetical protein
MRLETTSLPIIATLQEAYECMQTNDYEMLYIRGAHGTAKNRIYGLITRKHIESSYRS